MAEYGRSPSREELEKSGYRLPPSFFVKAAPDGSGEPSAEEKAQVEAMGKPAPEENKSLAPEETKVARKSARTRK